MCASIFSEVYSEFDDSMGQGKKKKLKKKKYMELLQKEGGYVQEEADREAQERKQLYLGGN